MTGNMAIWDAVSKTDPAYTTRVNQRGGFTAIDAHYQIEMATRQFGPIGIGWGYSASQPIFHEGMIIIPVTLWHGSPENTFGPVFGCAKFTEGRPDADAPKKAGTDALTKLLSQLGFNADVFLGKFDDNKYVAQRERECAAEAASQGIKDAWTQAVLDSLPKNATPRQAAEAFTSQIIADFQSKTGEKALENDWDRRAKLINRIKANNVDLWEKIVDAFEIHKEELRQAA